MSQSVLSIVRTARTLGVIHADIRSPNIMFRRSDLSAVLIDFGYTILRGADMSDATWASKVRSWSSMWGTRLLLKDTLMHDPTPVAYSERKMMPSPLTGWKAYNELRETMNPSRRDKYWIRTQLHGPAWILVKDDDRTVHQWHMRQWEIKPGARLVEDDDI
ncbi:hypothetical protein NEOLEDRAFT_263752 [Neolentinus lepideus HHB14362 ss-1]|uniref:Protein kinase domain-containing protein n=1 Tax=Neolentinus lepideus HHB14362 ss-1 TaxID=1314782 RepID=A0A165T2D0_9AGAM|nr:hypothetical protein NEOLEDRAFT_263752 [Neolentinus lepideus HHB14362 ss-1]